MGAMRWIGGVLGIGVLGVGLWAWLQPADVGPGPGDLLPTPADEAREAPALDGVAHDAATRAADSTPTADAASLLEALRAADLRGRFEILQKLEQRLPADAELIAWLVARVREVGAQDALFGWIVLRLGTLGPDARAWIDPLVADPHPAVRQLALRILCGWHRQGRLGDPPALHAVFDDPDRWVCYWARTLVAQGVPYEGALATRLAEESAAGDYLGACGLARMGTPGFERFLVVLEGATASARAVMFRALTTAPRERIRRALPQIDGGLRDTEPTVQAAALAALVPFGSDCAACLDALTRLLDDEQPDLALQAMGVLARIGPPASAATPLLLDLLDDRDESLSAAAAHALGAIGARPDLVVPALRTRVLEHHQDEAARALAGYGEPGERIAVDLLRSEDPWAQYAALWTLAARGPAAADRVADVVRFVRQDDDVDLRTRAVGTLGFIGEDAAAQGLPAILAALADRELPLDPKTAAGTLRLLGPRANEALRRALREGEPFLRLQVAHVLQHYPAESQFALEELAALLAGEDVELRRAAVLAMRVCVMHGERWDETYPAQHDADLHRRLRAIFEPLAKDRDEKVRAWSLELLETLDALARTRRP